MAGEKRRKATSSRRDESPNAAEREKRSNSPSAEGSGSEAEEEEEVRESSVERRARIAAWNAEKEKDDDTKQ